MYLPYQPNIPSVTAIRNYAFTGTTSLTSITLGAAPPTIGMRIFYISNTATDYTARTVTFHVPDVSAYQTANIVRPTGTPETFTWGDVMGLGSTTYDGTTLKSAFWVNTSRGANLRVALANR